MTKTTTTTKSAPNTKPGWILTYRKTGVTLAASPPCRRRGARTSGPRPATEPAGCRSDPKELRALYLTLCLR